MKELIKEQLEFFIEEEAEILYNEDCNFKHADPTTGQRCYDEDQIKDLIIEVMKEWK